MILANDVQYYIILKNALFTVNCVAGVMTFILKFLKLQPILENKPRVVVADFTTAFHFYPR